VKEEERRIDEGDRHYIRRNYKVVINTTCWEEGRRWEGGGEDYNK